MPSRKKGRFSAKDGEALVGGDDELVGLDLREVGVGGEVERDRRRDAEPDGETRVEFDGAVDEAPPVDDSGRGLRGRRRYGLHAPARL